MGVIRQGAFWWGIAAGVVGYAFVWPWIRSMTSGASSQGS